MSGFFLCLRNAFHHLYKQLSADSAGKVGLPVCGLLKLPFLRIATRNPSLESFIQNKDFMFKRVLQPWK
jgi:hypothetical protein